MRQVMILLCAVGVIIGHANILVAETLPDGYELPPLVNWRHQDETALAYAGNCDPLLAVLGPEDLEQENYFNLVSYGELYDHGLCVKYDPARAFLYFQKHWRKIIPIFILLLVGNTYMAMEWRNQMCWQKTY